jgi:hypothetical protein
VGVIGGKELVGVVDEIKLNIAGVLMVEKQQEIEKVLPDFQDKLFLMIFRTQTISQDTQDTNYFSGYGCLAEGLE